MEFDFELAINILPALLRGTVITLKAIVAGFAISLIGGLVLLLLRRSRVRVISRSVGFFVEFVRSTPFLIQLYFLYFVMPKYGLTLSPLTTGILTLGIHYSCYLSEVYRAGLENVSSGQWDAATALSFSPWQTYRWIIFPQAIPPIVPAAGTFLIYMFKESPFLAAISAPELMYVAQRIGSNTFQYLEPITMVGLIFLILSLGSAVLLRVAERKIGQKWR